MQEILGYWDRRQTIIALLGYPPLKDFMATQLQGARRYDRISATLSTVAKSGLPSGGKKLM